MLFAQCVACSYFRSFSTVFQCRHVLCTYFFQWHDHAYCRYGNAENKIFEFHILVDVLILCLPGSLLSVSAERAKILIFYECRRRSLRKSAGHPAQDRFIFSLHEAFLCRVSSTFGAIVPCAYVLSCLFAYSQVICFKSAHHVSFVLFECTCSSAQFNRAGARH